MSKIALVFEAVREGYSIDQLRCPITAGELRELLDDVDDDTIVVLSHDNGYTYGSLSSCEMRRERYDEDLDRWVRDDDDYDCY